MRRLGTLATRAWPEMHDSHAREMHVEVALLNCGVFVVVQMDILSSALCHATRRALVIGNASYT